MIRPLILSCVMLSLGGCGAISALSKAGRTLDNYELRGQQTAPARANNRGLQLIVEPPVVASSLDTARILIRPSATEVQYLPDGQWTDTPAKMLQTALVRELDDTGAFGYVGRVPLGQGGDEAIISEIIAFEAQLQPGGGVVTRMRVSAKIVREADLRIRSTRSFDVTVPAASTKTADLVAAMQSGMVQLVGQMRQWTLATL